jgi:polysaccharide biosynthesis transport protein
MGLEGWTHEGTTLHDYLRVLHRRKWILLQAVFLVPLAAVVFSLYQEPLYKASSSVLITNQDLSAAVLGIDSFVDRGSSEREAQTQADLARTQEVAARTVKAAEVDMSAREFLEISSAEPRTDADLIDLAVEHPDPRVAAALALAYAREFADFRLELDTQTIDSALVGVEQQLTSLELEGRESSALYRQLEERQQQLQELKVLQGQGIYPVGDVTSAEQISPRPFRDGVIGLLLGLVLGLGLAFLREALDTRVRVAEEISEKLGLTLLARLPSPPRKLASAEGLAMLEEPSGTQAEAFRVLRTNLEFVNLDRHAQAIMVTSALESEGKSTTASNLAVAMARAGKRVALVDLDLRRPSIARFFRLDGRPGLTQVALGHVDLEDALVPIPISAHRPLNGAGPEEPAANGQGGPLGLLEVLPSGPIPPDAGEFVATHAVGATLSQLRERSEVIIVDAPPLLGLGDAMALTSKVDGILLVTRLKTLRRHALNELRRVLDNAPASALGFVITNAETEKGYGYGYGPAQAYSQPEDARRQSRRRAGTPLR